MKHRLVLHVFELDKRIFIIFGGVNDRLEALAFEIRGDFPNVAEFELFRGRCKYFVLIAILFEKVFAYESVCARKQYFHIRLSPCSVELRVLLFGFEAVLEFDSAVEYESFRIL